MTKSILTVALLASLLTGTSCTDDDSTGLLLQPGYAEIKTIDAVATCKGPDGYYTTTVRTTADGSCLFFQEYEYKNAPFHSKITAGNKGYVTNGAGQELDTLSKEVTEMIRSHAFHKMHTDPAHFFRNIRFDQDISKDLAVYQANDRLDHPAKLYYKKEEKLLTKLELRNPTDTSQLIEIIFKNWSDSKYGKLVKELEIIQAKKDTFYFNYTQVEINQ